jgi:2-polyprenyl-3-methyl-5-hydroxy-6-metoxy-1,4-benzoquinol methylase
MEKNIYKNLYSDEKNLGNLTESIRIRKMARIIDSLNLENKNIFDIGCYDGTFLDIIENRNNNFFGLEASDWGVERCCEKNINVQQYFFNDKNKLPYENNFFDVVIAGEIIEHIYDTDFFLEEIYRILKPGGKVLVSTPNIASLGRRLFLLFGINPIIELSPNESDSSGHIRYFTFKTLRRLLQKHKFGVIGIKSDCINFSNTGKLKSEFLADIFPRLGTSIICLSRKKKNNPE